MKNVSILKMILQNETILYETNMYKAKIISLQYNEIHTKTSNIIDLLMITQGKINNLILHQILFLQSEE